MRLSFGLKDVRFFLRLIRERETFSSGAVEDKMLRKLGDQFSYYGVHGRLNFSRVDVDFLVGLLESRRKSLVKPSGFEVDRSLRLKDELLDFRFKVWGDTKKEE